MYTCIKIYMYYVCVSHSCLFLKIFLKHSKTYTSNTLQENPSNISHPHSYCQTIGTRRDQILIKY